MSQQYRHAAEGHRPLITSVQKGQTREMKYAYTLHFLKDYLPCSESRWMGAPVILLYNLQRTICQQVHRQSSKCNRHNGVLAKEEKSDRWKTRTGHSDGLTWEGMCSLSRPLFTLCFIMLYIIITQLIISLLSCFKDYYRFYKNLNLSLYYTIPLTDQQAGA